MEQVLINEIEPAVMERLRRRAVESGRPLEVELRSILERAAQCDWISVAPELERVRGLFDGRKFDDSAAILSEDRR